MKHGKSVCNTLKQIRLNVARANGIDYVPTPCSHKGDCAGTCPACESEVEYIEKEISRRHSLGKAVLIAGIGLTSLTSMAGTSSNAATAFSSGIETKFREVITRSLEAQPTCPAFPGVMGL
ncbi:MAG: hypothetical protein IJ925_07860 [Muribaculaceae bacterium]|nr:hypothetical protein [Muribaculaceae bacterium]